MSYVAYVLVSEIIRLSRGPNVQSETNKQLVTVATRARIELPQPGPKVSYISSPNKGRLNPAKNRATFMAASAEAAYLWLE